MKRMAFNPRFVNGAGDDLIPGKIHTIRRNFAYWKKFEGREVELFTWEGKPYRSKQKVFCVKRIVSVQKVYMQKNYDRQVIEFLLESPSGTSKILESGDLWKNDGFRCLELFEDWFVKYADGDMAVIQFMGFRYG